MLFSFQRIKPWACPGKGASLVCSGDAGQGKVLLLVIYGGPSPPVIALVIPELQGGFLLPEH